MTQNNNTIFQKSFQPIDSEENCKALSSWVSIVSFFEFFSSIACQCIVSNLYTRLVESYVAYKWTSYFHLIRFRDFTKHFPTFLYKISKILTIFCEILEVWWMQIQTFIQMAKRFVYIRDCFLAQKDIFGLDVK